MEIIEKIGRGSFGAVYKVKVDGQRRAAKTSYDDSIDYENAQLNRVNHINIVSAFGIHFHENVFYLIMEYMEGGSMKDLLRSRHFILKDVINWFGQVAAGLSYLHAMTPLPMLHRDIKPQNILLSGDMQVAKIGDFGTSRDLASTMTNNIGTSLYMAPEVFESRKYTEKCDVYSFGISLWEMLARKRPFAEYDTAEQIQYAAYKGKRPSFEGLGFHRILIDLISLCWHGDPTERPVMEIVFKVLRNTLKLYKLFERSTELLAGNVVGKLNKKRVLLAEHQAREFLTNIQNRNINTEINRFVQCAGIVGIVDDSKFNGIIFHDEWTYVEDALDDLMLQYFHVRNTITWLGNSVRLIAFKNTRSLELFVNAIAEIGEVYPGAQLRVIGLGTQATALLPNEPSDPEAILEMLGVSNPEVPIDYWKVLEIEKCAQNQIQVILQLNNDSVKYLSKRKWILNYGLNTVRLSMIQTHYELLDYESGSDEIESNSESDLKLESYDIEKAKKPSSDDESGSDEIESNSEYDLKL